MKQLIRKVLHTYEYMLKVNTFTDFVETVTSEIDKSINKKKNGTNSRSRRPRG